MRIKYVLFLTAVLMAAAAFGLCWVVSHAASGRHRPFPAPQPVTFNFGAVFPGQSLAHAFLIPAERGSARRFIKITTSCGCTSAWVRPVVLNGGEAAKMHVRVEAKYWPGPELVLVRAVVARASSRQHYVFRLLYQVRRVISVGDNPVYLDMGRYDAAGSRPEKNFQITRDSNPMVWDTLRCASDSQAITTSLTRLTADHWCLTLRPRSTNILGAITAPVKFSFWEKGRRLAYILRQLVTMNMLGPVLASPDSLLIGAVPVGKRRDFSIRVTSPDGAAPSSTAITGVSVGRDSRMEAKIGRIGGFPCALLRYRASPPTGRESGTITIRVVSKGRKYVLEVSYLAMILPPAALPPGAAGR